MKATTSGGTSARDTNRNGLRPTLSSAAIGTDGVTLTLTFNKKIVGNNGFTIDASGGAATIVYTSGIATNLVFTISRTIIDTETVTLDYAAGDVQGLHGGDLLATITDSAVTNNSEQTEEPSDTTPPSVLSATLAVNGVTLTIVFDEAVTGNAGFTITPSGGAATIAYSSGAGSAALVYTANRTIQYGETIVLDYTAGDVEDLASNALEAIVDLSVTNNSTQTDPGEPPVGAIVIDNDWLTANGPSPYYLDQAGAYYWLSVDVTTDGTAFAIIAQNVTLDLNQRTIIYDNAAPIEIVNGSFEEGTGDTPTGWDLNGSAWTRFAGDYLSNQVFDGDYSLRIAVPCANQYVINQTLITLPANTTLTLSAMFTRKFTDTTAAPAKLYVELVGQNGEPTRRVSRNTGNNRGMQFVEFRFTTGVAEEEYQLRAGIEDADDAPVNAAFIDDIKIQRTRVYGVAYGAYGSSAEEYPDIDRYGAADNSIVKNGFIYQGQGNGSWAHNIYARGGTGLTVDEITGIVQGANSSNINVLGGAGQSITDNHFTSNVIVVSNRDQFYGSMIGNGASGTISGNTLLNGPHAGIRTLSTAQCFVFNNTLRMKNRYTNGFAIQPRGPNSECHDNVIDQGTGEYSGRGISLAGTGVNGVLCYNNTITVQGLANNQEYGGAVLGGAYGIQCEATTSAEIYGNTVTVNAEFAEGAALRLNHSPILNVHDNTFIAIQVDSAYEVQCLSCTDLLYGVDPELLPTFEDNTMITNKNFIGGSGSNSEKVELLIWNRTTLEVNGAVTNARWFESSASATNSLHAMTYKFIDNIYADVEAETAWEEGKFMRFGYPQTDTFAQLDILWTTTIHCRNAALAPIEGATVVVVDTDDIEVFSGTTDASGNCVVEIRESSADGAAPVSFNPHTATGTSGALTDDAEFTADQVQTITLTLI